MANSLRSAPPATLEGSETPRVWTPPRRELTPKTSLGFEAIRFAEDILGLTLHPWQRWLFVHALELDDAGAFRFRTLVILIARQNGKTTWMQVLALWRMYVDGSPLVIGTAQNLDVAEEAWAGAVERAEAVPELQAMIASVDRTNGKKALRLDSGERYKVQAASRRGGRGLSGDLVVLDELREHAKWDAWAAVSKTTMARPRPQIVCLSNAGDKTSVVLAHLRETATSALNDPASTVGLFEWSAPAGCDLHDEAGWVAANPSLGHTLSADAIRAALETDPDDVLRTEVLCQWVEVAGELPYPIGDWRALTDPNSSRTGIPQFGIDTNPIRSWSAIAACDNRTDGFGHVELLGYHEGTADIVVAAATLQERYPDAEFAIAADSAAASLIPDLEDANVRVRKYNARDYVASCGLFSDAVRDRTIRHVGQDVLDEAIQVARKRELEGAWALARKSGDICPLVAAVLAHHLWATANTDYDISDSIL